ncbi:MAG: hypothetical protein ACLR8P_16775 [Clostridium fessum]
MAIGGQPGSYDSLISAACGFRHDTIADAGRDRASLSRSTRRMGRFQAASAPDRPLRGRSDEGQAACASYTAWPVPEPDEFSAYQLPG